MASLLELPSVRFADEYQRRVPSDRRLNLEAKKLLGSQLPTNRPEPGKRVVVATVC